MVPHFSNHMDWEELVNGEEDGMGVTLEATVSVNSPG